MASNEVKSLWNTLKDLIIEEVDGVKFQQKKAYARFYLLQNNENICTIEAQRSKINLFYSTKKAKLKIPTDDFVKDYAGKGHLGLGDYGSEIRTAGDIKKAIPIVRKVYDAKMHT